MLCLAELGKPAALKQIDVGRIRKWVVVGEQGVSGPASIATVCPFCSEKVVFTTKRRHYDQPRDVLSCSAECPSCDGVTHFWLSDLLLQKIEDDVSATLYMMPSAREFLDITVYKDVVPDGLSLSYSSTLAAYNSGNLAATGVLFRSTLESIFTHLLPPASDDANSANEMNLVETIANVHTSVDLGMPLINVAHALKPGGKLDELFAAKKQSDPAVAEAMMELLDRLIYFLYVLPQEFSKLEQFFNNSGTDRRYAD